MAAQVKVHVCGLGLLRSRVNVSPVCDDSAAEGGMHKCGAILLALPFACLLLTHLVTIRDIWELTCY